MSKIVYEKEYRQIYRLLFKVQNDLGTNFQEKHYHRAFKAGLIINNMPYQKNVPIEISYQGRPLGKFFLDFVINNKIIIELKTAD